MSRATWRRCYDGSNRHDTTLEGDTLRCRSCGQVATVAVAAPETLTLKVPSQSDPRLEYTVHIANGAATCNCRGYSSHGKCKHATAALAVLAEEKQETHA